MKLNEYQQRAMSTCTESSNNFMYMLTGLTAEVGEINDKIAKGIRKGQISVNNNNLCFDNCLPEFLEELNKEVGDTLWFVAGMAHTLGCSLDHVGETNITKLADRKQRGVIIGEGDNR